MKRRKLVAIMAAAGRGGGGVVGARIGERSRRRHGAAPGRAGHHRRRDHSSPVSGRRSRSSSSVARSARKARFKVENDKGGVNGRDDQLSSAGSTTGTAPTRTSQRRVASSSRKASPRSCPVLTPGYLAGARVRGAAEGPGLRLGHLARLLRDEVRFGFSGCLDAAAAGEDREQHVGRSHRPVLPGPG